MTRDIGMVEKLIGSGTKSWRHLRKLTGLMSDSELAEAEALERLGRRRENMLVALKAERQERRARRGKMLHLRVEANL